MSVGTLARGQLVLVPRTDGPDAICNKTLAEADIFGDKEVSLQCDASKYALGSVQLQEGKPVAYTPRALNDTEQRYAQIEKETLAIVHGREKFHYYLFGRPVTVQSDHSPLQSIFAKPLHAAPVRLQSLMLKLQKYDVDVVYVPDRNNTHC